MLEIFLLLILSLFLKAVQPGIFVTLFLVGLWIILALPGAMMIFKLAPPLVPTPNRTVKKMLEFANIKTGTLVYDLGCGDGRIVRAAAKQGATAIGYEISLPTYFLAWLWSLPQRNVQIRFGNFWKKDFTDADVIFCYLMPDQMKKFMTEAWPKLKSGTRVISHGFRMKDLKTDKEEAGVFLYVRM